ncbi:MAG: TRAP transporter small permease [Lawsonibacter sp.]|nr:TRAP transporter small permease [Lawsonibacter sp.]
MKALKWVDKNFEVIFMVLTLIAVSAIMTAQIIARRFMGTSIAWSEEMCRYLFIWMGFLSISHSVRAKSIIKLDIVELLLPPAVIKAVTVAVDLLMAALFACLTYQSMDIIRTTNQRWSSLDISMNLVYGAIPICFALTALRFLEMFVIDIRQKAVKKDAAAIGEEYAAAERENAGLTDVQEGGEP